MLDPDDCTFIVEKIAERLLAECVVERTFTDFFIPCLQLYWPDDKMWYLVEISRVLPKQRQATYVADN